MRLKDCMVMWSAPAVQMAAATIGMGLKTGKPGQTLCASNTSRHMPRSPEVTATHKLDLT